MSHCQLKTQSKNFGVVFWRLLVYVRRVAKRAVKGLSVGEARTYWETDRLTPGNNQRMFFPGIVELSELIADSGHVAELEVTDKGVIVSGERRWRACCLLNDSAKKKGEDIPWPKLPVFIVEPDADYFTRNVSENAGREQLRFIEWARIFKTYREKYELTNEQIAKKTGYESFTVSRYINVVEKLSPKIVSKLEDGVIYPTDILIKLSQIKDHEVQLLRLEQWLGTAAHQTSDVKQAKQRSTALSRRKQVALIKLLQEANYPPEAIAVAQFIAGQKATLPNQLHLKLSRKRRPQVSG